MPTGEDIPAAECDAVDAPVLSRRALNRALRVAADQRTAARTWRSSSVDAGRLEACGDATSRHRRDQARSREPRDVDRSVASRSAAATTQAPHAGPPEGPERLAPTRAATRRSVAARSTARPVALHRPPSRRSPQLMAVGGVHWASIDRRCRRRSRLRRRRTAARCLIRAELRADGPAAPSKTRSWRRRLQRGPSRRPRPRAPLPAINSAWRSSPSTAARREMSVVDVVVGCRLPWYFFDP